MKDIEFGDYIIRELSNEEFSEYFNLHKEIVFSDDIAVFPDEYLSEDDQVTSNALNQKFRANMVRVNLAAFTKSGDFVGWSYGFQNDFYTYYMCNSAVLEAHRRKGIYNKLLDAMVDRAIELGFKRITSRHNSTNNSIIIPKLKKGFVITTLEVSETFGTLVHLCYHVHPVAREIMDFRCGQKKPSTKLKDILKL